MARTVDRMSVEEFTEACARGYEDEAKSMLERNPGLHNMRDTRGYTGLMRALRFEHPTLYRWLLSLHGLDTNVRDEDDTTALHCGCQWGAPLDIVFTLVRLSSWETVNIKEKDSDVVMMTQLWTGLYRVTTPAPPSTSPGWGPSARRRTGSTGRSHFRPG